MGCSVKTSPCKSFPVGGGQGPQTQPTGLLITAAEWGEQCVLAGAGVGEGTRAGQKGWWLLLMVTVSARIHRWLGSEFRQASGVWGRAFPLPPVEL